MLVVSLKEVLVFVRSASVCGHRDGIAGVILLLTAFYALPDVKASRFPSNTSSAVIHIITVKFFKVGFSLDASREFCTNL